MSKVPDKLGLYIHIPFCKKKCNYCDFVSYQEQDEKIEAYINSLKKEIKIISEHFNSYSISTIFFGGGTPSYLDENFISSILEECNICFDLTNTEEISIETNPGTLNNSKLSRYKYFGINRLSIGLQACQNKLLKSIGRIHSFEEFLEGYNIARKSSFNNINIDLIFGLPGQTLSDWRDTLNKVLSLKPEHLSCYSLKIEEHTLFHNMYLNKLIEFPTDEEEREMYHYTVSTLKFNGYIQYEISNFCLPGYQCKHNLIYWNCEQYIGIGAGAHSYFDNIRYSNHTSLDKYILEINKGRLPQQDFQTINKQESMIEFIILGLRLIDGVDKNSFKQKFNNKIDEMYSAQISKLLELGLIENEKHRLKLTSKGLDLANQVMIEFLN